MAATVTGGDKLMAHLNGIQAGLASAGTGPSVRIGFLESATYPDGTSVAGVAAIQEFGATINRQPGTVTVFRKVAAAGTHFLRNGRFVKRSQSNFSTTHAHGAYTITIPPRPFFRRMIKAKARSWPGEIVTLLRDNKYDAAKTLKKMGELIAGQLRQSIVDLVDPALAASTIRRKGSSKPLIVTGVMLRNVDYEVTT